MASDTLGAPENLEALRRWGWSDEFTEHWRSLDSAIREQCQIARIVEDPRGAFMVQGSSHDEGPARAEVIGQLRKGDALWPAVGDWVAIDASQLIRQVLPRKGLLQRKAAGESEDIQALAANIDCALIVTSPNQDLSPRRIERMLLAIREANATPLLLLNKCDLIEPTELQSLLEDLRARLNQLNITAVSALSGNGLAELLQSVRTLVPNSCPTIALLGSSGVGKSTLTNALLGNDTQPQRTSEIRSDDSKGRHTTTGRRLLRTPHQLLLIDMPGVREFQLADPESSLESRLDEEFSDIQELALRCRFTNCGHEREPGCQIRASLDQAALDPDRVHSWRKLLAEIQSRRAPKKSSPRTRR
jgi:ribosome biogenesis GTPase